MSPGALLCGRNLRGTPPLRYQSPAFVWLPLGTIWIALPSRNSKTNSNLVIHIGIQLLLCPVPLGPH